MNIRVIKSPSAGFPFAVIYKPAGLPSAPLEDGGDSALVQACSLFPEIGRVCGKKAVERGLVHRIDTATSGLLLMASSQESYDSALRFQHEGKFVKFYRAGIDRRIHGKPSAAGFPDFAAVYPDIAAALDEYFSGGAVPPAVFSVESLFRRFGPGGRQVRPVAANSGRAALRKSGACLYSTSVRIVGHDTAECSIRAGFRHQVRCHLSWCGIPVRGDRLYNPESCVDAMEFSAFRIDFPDPETGRILSFSV
mgnify:CR=1 FL=1